MKKITMNAAKLRLKKDQVISLSDAGQVQGGLPVYSVTSYCNYVCVNTVNAGWCVPEIDQSKKPPKSEGVSTP